MDAQQHPRCCRAVMMAGGNTTYRERQACHHMCLCMHSTSQVARRIGQEVKTSSMCVYKQHPRKKVLRSTRVVVQSNSNSNIVAKLWSCACTLPRAPMAGMQSSHLTKSIFFLRTAHCPCQPAPVQCPCQTFERLVRAVCCSYHNATCPASAARCHEQVLYTGSTLMCMPPCIAVRPAALLRPARPCQSRTLQHPAPCCSDVMQLSH